MAIETRSESSLIGNAHNSYTPCQVYYQILDDGSTPDSIYGIDLKYPPNAREGKYTRISILSTRVFRKDSLGGIALCSNKKGYLELCDGVATSQRMIITYDNVQQSQHSVSIDFYTKAQYEQEALNGELYLMVRNSIHAGDTPVPLKGIHVGVMRVAPMCATLIQPPLVSDGPNGVLPAQLATVMNALPLISRYAFDIYLENLALNKTMASKSPQNDLHTWFSGLAGIDALGPQLAACFLRS